MPNPWDVGSARLLAASGFEALATTSAGFAWALGKHDQTVTRDELVAHVTELAAATELPLNVDSERCYPDDPGGVPETVALLAEAGAAGFSIEDYDPATDGWTRSASPPSVWRWRPTLSRRLPEPMVLTARAENHIRGVDDLDDTITRLIAYRDAGAGALYAPGLTDLEQIGASCRGGDPAERPHPAGWTDCRRARPGGRPPRLDGEPAGGEGLRRPGRGGSRAAREGIPPPSAASSRAHALSSAFS